ncbi:hypothetical protein CRG98_032616 [Punica granatum]|uniref:Uncharacterized protein n=1 Tax=Punica granatum TaxID=22663 RepID=A0A2I0ISK7_PUNGR|nr:hypothetical protein CRG98_032616 [Punica granatum]
MSWLFPQLTPFGSLHPQLACNLQLSTHGHHFTPPSAHLRSPQLNSITALSTPFHIPRPQFSLCCSARKTPFGSQKPTLSSHMNGSLSSRISPLEMLHVAAQIHALMPVLIAVELTLASEAKSPPLFYSCSFLLSIVITCCYGYPFLSFEGSFVLFCRSFEGFAKFTRFPPILTRERNLGRRADGRSVFFEFTVSKRVR